MALTNLIPARFLCLIAHLVITVTLIWSRDANVRACLPETYTDTEYNTVDVALIIGLSLSIVFLVIEIIGFMSGVSMFIHPVGLLSTTCHASAAIALSFYLFEEWPCYIFWYIFGFCSAFPALVEIAVLIAVLGLKKVR
ncbi:transmembrane protein 107-like [Lytechinus variegatus]|uniref:transmembrane protein 107-like n=1 Tax=Lytechinus variegatus TaxID=7654 RepID=UPI001BB2C06F|nr:transmembrane protein 107-like [Lytechinus variegatus]XP_041479469.1 transmembrane protein 107-like [Lytechinus variegatus]